MVLLVKERVLLGEQKVEELVLGEVGLLDVSVRLEESPNPFRHLLVRLVIRLTLMQRQKLVKVCHSDGRGTNTVGVSSDVCPKHFFKERPEIILGEQLLT